MDTEWETVTESSEDSQHVDDPATRCTPDSLPSDKATVSAGQTEEDEDKASAPSGSEGPLSVCPWPSHCTGLVTRWLADDHEGPRSDGPATLLVSLKVTKMCDWHKKKEKWLTDFLLECRFCGSSSGCALDEEPAAATFASLAALVRDLIKPDGYTPENWRRPSNGTSAAQTTQSLRYERIIQHLMKDYVRPVWHQMERMDQVAWTEAFDYGNRSQLENASLELSRALAQGVCDIYYRTIKKRGFDTTDETRLVRIGSVSFEDLKKLDMVKSKRWTVDTFQVAQPSLSVTGSESPSTADLMVEGIPPPGPSTRSNKPGEKGKEKRHVQRTKYVTTRGPDGLQRTEAW